MKIAILGYGKEGKSAERWLRRQYPSAEIRIFDDFKVSELKGFGLDNFDLILRTPSVSPNEIKQVAPSVEMTSITQIFFEKCPCNIIGITGTKGKGTTASMIRDLLESLGKKVWLVGNIGVPALDILNKIKEDDIVVYELSSFQLWDLERSPHIAVILRVEPDHLNVHRDFEDYVVAKANIAKWQDRNDFCIYYHANADSVGIANLSKAQKMTYPVENIMVKRLVGELRIAGEHNKENAEAALLTTAAALNMKLEELIEQYKNRLSAAIREFKGLPHRLEFICDNNGIKYYDDSFSSAFPAMNVAIDTFANQPTIIIAGGLDRGLDLTAAKKKLFSSKNVKKVILIGQTKEKLASGEDPRKYQLTEDLTEAVRIAETEAKKYGSAVVVLSPGAASFDMFKNFEERGQKFQEIVRGLLPPSYSD